MTFCVTRQLMIVSAAFATLFALPSHANANFPSAPLKIVVPYAPGGGVDFIGRVIGNKLSESFGQPVIIENRAGAGSMIGSSAVATAAPDGYTALLNGGTLAMQPSLVKNLSYDVVRDFKPVGKIVSYGLTLIMNSKIPAENLQQFIDYARTTEIFYGSPGVGTTPHLAAELFKSVTGLNMTHVPYKGNGPLKTAIVAGDVQIGFDTVQGSKPLADAGSIRILALSGKSRSTSAPSIPTAREAGLENYALDMWQGLFLPKNTPDDIVNKWNEALNKVLTDPELIAQLRNNGFEITTTTPKELGELVDNELRLWADVVRKAGIQPE